MAHVSHLVELYLFTEVRDKQLEFAPKMSLRVQTLLALIQKELSTLNLEDTSVDDARFVEKQVIERRRGKNP